MSDQGSAKRKWFFSFAKWASFQAGRPHTFIGSAMLIVLWMASGPLFGFSDTWQLVINTGTTIVTFLMVFLIQNTQNRDTEAIQLKLDELIRATQGAHTSLMDIEELGDEQMQQFRDRFEALAEEGREDLRRGGKDTNRPRLRTKGRKAPGAADDAQTLGPTRQDSGKR